MCIYPNIHPLHLFEGLVTMALTTTQCHHRAPPTHLPLSTFSTNPSSFSNLSFSSSSFSHKLSLSKNYTYGYGNAQFKISPKNKVPAFYNHFILHVPMVFDIMYLLFFVCCFTMLSWFLIWDHGFLFVMYCNILFDYLVSYLLCSKDWRLCVCKVCH